MAKNEELQNQILELAEKLGIDPPDVAHLKNAELAAMLGDLRASAPSPEEEPNPEGAAADAVRAREDALSDKALARSEAAKAFEYVVAPRKSVSRTRTRASDKGVSTELRPGGIIGPGEEIKATDLKNGETDLARLVDIGTVLKG